jgi:hypothetical protein
MKSSKTAGAGQCRETAQFTEKFPEYRQVISSLKRMVNANNVRMGKQWPQ